MRWTGLSVVVIALLAAVSVFAATLTDNDYRYLRAHWGLDRNGEVAKALTAAEQAKLHELINDPSYRDNPQAIENHVGDYLFKIETCFTWVESHPSSEPCPRAADIGALPGKKVADRYCNACHLTGTAEARSFFRLSEQGGWTERRLAAVVASGHYMSPITLSESELGELAAYIASLK